MSDEKYKEKDMLHSLLYNHGLWHYQESKDNLKLQEQLEEDDDFQEELPYHY